jgi:hypothetical protein
MHVVVAVTPAHPARRSLSKRRNQPATWFHWRLLASPLHRGNQCAYTRSVIDGSRSPSGSRT